MKKLFLLFFFIVALFLSTEAKYVQTCNLKYERQDDWSDYYEVTVTFETGDELNKATNTFNYKSFSTYAVVFWDDDNTSIIEISTPLFCNSKATRACIVDVTTTGIEGKDQNGRHWKICVMSYCY